VLRPLNLLGVILAGSEAVASLLAWLA
jgi:hypothetical protein